MQNSSKIHISSQSYHKSTNTLIANAGSGLYNLLIGARCSSLKSMYISVSSADAIEKKFAGVNPNLTQGSCLIIGGLSFLQRTINPLYHPSDAFISLQKSIGALSIANYNGCINKVGYCTSSTTTGLMIAYNTAIANALSNPNQFYLGFDTETIMHRGGLLSGININSTPSFFRCRVDSQLSAYVHTLYFFAYHDVILEIDVLAKNIIAKF